MARRNSGSIAAVSGSRRAKFPTSVAGEGRSAVTSDPLDPLDPLDPDAKPESWPQRDPQNAHDSGFAGK